MPPLVRLWMLGWLALGLTAGTAFAQSSVWKISRGDSSFYLGGTCHVLRPGDFPLPPEFDTAFAGSAKVYFETDVARILSDEIQDVIAREGRFTDRTTLPDVLAPEIWRAVQAYANRSGLPAEQLRRMRPWLLVVMMAATEMQKIGITSEGVDFHYYERAVRSRKPTGELEDFDRHIAFLTRLGAGHENEMIAQTLEDLAEIPETMARLLAAWRAGQVDQIEDLLLSDMRAKYPAIFNQLLVSRNESWLPKLDRLLATREVEFVLVGVAHVAGPEGLLAGLRALGCTIEQIKATAAPSAAAE